MAEHRACRTVGGGLRRQPPRHRSGGGTRRRARLQAASPTTSARSARVVPSTPTSSSDDGSVVDDIIVWWVADERFDVMPNASNTSRVLAALGGVDTTTERAVVAVQGPLARRAMADVSREAAAVAAVRGAHLPLARARVRRWRGRGTRVRTASSAPCRPPPPTPSGKPYWRPGPCRPGSVRRDTLRLEAGLPLHGHELGPGITPLQAGLGWVVGWDKGPFPGRDALRRERARARAACCAACWPPGVGPRERAPWSGPGGPRWAR